MTDDYDSPWKEAIEQYFEEFVAFFFPKAYKQIDWSRGYEFLDKELRQITKKAEISRKYVDKLVKVWLKDQNEVWAVIHADVQNQREEDFSRRMYVYNYRLFDRYGRHAASFAVLGDANPNWRPSQFTQELMGCKVNFKFPTVKLSDYRKKIQKLEKSRNPFAVVVMAHLKTQETAKDHVKRMNEKLAIVKMLYRKGFSKQDIISLFRFIDWIMELPEPMDSIFWQELEAAEKEEKMPYITSVERLGYKRGIEEGVLKAIELGLHIRFGQQGLGLMNEISKIRNSQTLNAVYEGLKNVSEIGELRQLYKKGKRSKNAKTGLS